MFLEIFRQYTRRLRDASALDFDDLIAETVYLFRAFPKVASLYQRRFRHILVDEYQDTNHAQYSLIRELTQPVPADRVVEMEQHGVNVAALTDAAGGIPGPASPSSATPTSAIYAFRGADIRNIVEFERDFPGAKVVLLEQNYRSTQNILSAANAVISNNFDRKEKKLWTADGDGDQITGYTGYTAHDEAQFVADEIEVLHRAGVAYRDIAVFYRTNAQTRALEEIFVRSALPYRVVGGTKFYERAEIKDAMAYLIAVANPLDELALRRILNTPKRGIGPATETALASFAEQNALTFRQAMRAADGLGLGPKVTGAITTLANVLDEAAAMLVPSAAGVAAGTNEGASKVSDVLVFLLERSGLIDALRNSRDPQDETRAENVEELVAQTRDFDRENPGSTLLDFLTQVSLVAAADELDDASGTVSLMTLHTAKGLEYHAVFLTGLEEGLLPHQMSASEPGGPAEERRLFYVGITRARKRLYLSLAMSRAQFGEVGGGDALAIPAGDPRGTHRLEAVARHGDLAGRHAAACAQRPARLRPGRRRAGARATATSSGSASRRAPRPRPSGRTGSPAPCATTATSRSRPATASATSTSARGGSPQVTGEGTKRIAHVAFDTAGQKKLLIKIAPIEKL